MHASHNPHAILPSTFMRLHNELCGSRTPCSHHISTSLLALMAMGLLSRLCWAKGQSLAASTAWLSSRMHVSVGHGLLQCGGDEQPGRPGSPPCACSARDQEPDAKAGYPGARSCPPDPRTGVRPSQTCRSTVSLENVRRNHGGLD